VRCKDVAEAIGVRSGGFGNSDSKAVKEANGSRVSLRVIEGKGKHQGLDYSLLSLDGPGEIN